MSSVDSSNTSRSLLDRLIVPVLLACIGAIATVAAACFTSTSGPRTQICSRFNDRYDRLSDLPDSKSKLKHLNIIVEIQEYKDCPNYNEAARERDYLRQEYADRNAWPTQTVGRLTSDGTPTRRSAAVAPPELPPVPEPTVAASPSPKIVDAVSAPPPAPVGFFDRLVRAKTSGGEKTVSPLIASREPSKPLPEIVVRPLPPFSDPDLPFEGGVGEKLVMKKGDRFQLKPAQYNTTTYNVAKGNIVVEVGGTPYFYCKSGDVFRLYWKSRPNFVATSSDARSNLTITSVAFGKHLSTSTCLDAPG